MKCRQTKLIMKKFTSSWRLNLRKKGSVSAVREMMVLTFKQRRSETTKVEDANPTKVALQNFPFLAKELAVSIEYCCTYI